MRSFTYYIRVEAYKIILSGAYFQRETEVVMDLELMCHKNIGIRQTRGLALLVILVVHHQQGITKEGFHLCFSIHIHVVIQVSEGGHFG